MTRGLTPIARLILPLLAVGCLVLTGCDGPLSHQVLIDRLGRGNYARFVVVYYRFAPSAMKEFLDQVGTEQYAYEAILDSGPIERLQFAYRPKTNHTTLIRTGNEFDSGNASVTEKDLPRRGPLEDVIRALKGNPDSARDLFARDLYATVDQADVEYYRAIDDRVRQLIRSTGGVQPEWQFVEFTLEYQLPQAGTPVITAESALIPLGTGGPGAALVAPLRGIADEVFAELPDPLE